MWRPPLAPGQGIPDSGVAWGPSLRDPSGPAVRYLLLDTDLYTMRNLLTLPFLLSLVAALISLGALLKTRSLLHHFPLHHQLPLAPLPPRPLLSQRPIFCRKTGDGTNLPSDLTAGHQPVQYFRDGIPAALSCNLVPATSMWWWTSLKNVGYPEGYGYHPDSAHAHGLLPTAVSVSHGIVQPRELVPGGHHPDQ